MPVTCCYCEEPIQSGQEIMTHEGWMHESCHDEWAGVNLIGYEDEEERRPFWD
jgi:hypothetical protein